MGNPLVETGKLDRRITIERAMLTKNRLNEDVPGWAPSATRWASKKPAPGTERFQNSETAAQAPMRFVFRWEAGLVTVQDRLLDEDDGRRYGIVSVTEIGWREGWEVLGVARGEEA